MKIIKFILFTSIVFSILCFYSCELGEKIEQGDRITIAIVNPSVHSLIGFKSLIDNGILDIPNAQYLAICYEQVERNIAAVEHFIRDQENDLFRLEILSGKISGKNIFSKNELSEQFLKVFQSTEGIFFLGGADIPPGIYNQKTNLLSSVTTPRRHLFELSFLFHLLGGRQDSTFIPYLHQKDNYKVIGFCLGMQTMNVATGGSMYQDIPTDIYEVKYVEDVLSLDKNQMHVNYWQDLAPDNDMTGSYFHQIKAVKSHHFFNNKLWADNKSPFVYSSHHQAVKIPGKDLEILASSMDGKVIEIIGHKIFANAFGVQFHPEVSSLYLSDQKKYKWSPDDMVPRSYNEFLDQTNSLSFHKKFWQEVSRLYQ